MFQTATERMLESGAFEPKGCPELAADVQAVVEADPQAWSDIKQSIRGIQDGTCRRKEAGDIPPDGDWDAPLARTRNQDVGEIRRRIDDNGRLYRLYVHAPPSPPGTLLLLHLAWKPSNEDDGVSIQNAQIAVAAERLQNWYSARHS
ncbi:hypothetical protein HZU40_25050 [Mycolicibacterium fluoranthenivorans]|uniref:Uncharacterized protein n=1 Tax=Mycolicibacterium fluoranthenivorans TaxID=258505 RepID=A0A7G8PAS4_9MYCO|nr:hypothetical protein [Mycolicibacterium fluoranthenivorans]QNJ91440.1 hypothetical protein HZU40_25050 [Mycolicibacterium fluoranthenivorans]